MVSYVHRLYWHNEALTRQNEGDKEEGREKSYNSIGKWAKWTDWTKKLEEERGKNQRRYFLFARKLKLYLCDGCCDVPHRPEMRNSHENDWTKPNSRSRLISYTNKINSDKKGTDNEKTTYCISDALDDYSNMENLFSSGVVLFEKVEVMQMNSIM